MEGLLVGFVAFLAVAAFFAGIGAIIIVAAWSFVNSAVGPLAEGARNRQCPVQFGLADLLCLFVLIQLPVGTIHWGFRDVLGARIIVLDIVLAAFATSLWWTGVRTLSRAGVQVTWQRCIVLTLGLPAAYVSSVGLIVLPCWAAYFLMTGEAKPATVVWPLIVEVILPFILYALGRFNAAIVAAGKEEPQGRERETGENT
jgi:hypothetical protein